MTPRRGVIEEEKKNHAEGSERMFAAMNDLAVGLDSVHQDAQPNARLWLAAKRG